MVDIDHAAKVLGEAAGLRPSQLPGLALVLRMLVHEAWREGMLEAARIAPGNRGRSSGAREGGNATHEG